MRKLTALTVAFSLSAAGQALAGPPHAPAAHAPAAPAAHTTEVQSDHAKAKLEVIKAVENAPPEQQQKEQKAQQRAQQAVQQAKAESIPCPTCIADGLLPALVQNYVGPELGTLARDAKKIDENPGETIAKIDDAKITEAEKTAAVKTEVIDTAKAEKSADAPNSGAANAVATAESQNAGK